MCISVTIYMYASHKKKLLKTVRFLNILLEKMEILHLNFCRYF